MLGSAVSSSTPRDFHPNSHMGHWGSRPLMNSHAFTPGPTHGCPYIAVGMQRALASLIGLPRRSRSALSMVGFLMPADVSRSFMRPPGVVAAGRERAYGFVRRYRDWRAGENSSVAHFKDIRERSPGRCVELRPNA